jgi:hypothetical protein
VTEPAVIARQLAVKFPEHTLEQIAEKVFQAVTRLRGNALWDKT